MGLKKYFSDWNTVLEKTSEIIYLILLSLKEDNFFFKLKRISLWVILRIYYATAQTFISLIQRKRKQSRNFFKSKKIFFDRITMHKFVWFKEILFKSKILFSGYKVWKRTIFLEIYIITLSIIIKNQSFIQLRKF